VTLKAISECWENHKPQEPSSNLEKAGEAGRRGAAVIVTEIGHRTQLMISVEEAEPCTCKLP